MYSKKRKPICFSRHISVIKSQRLKLVCLAQDDNTGLEIENLLRRRWISYKADSSYYFTLLLRLLFENFWCWELVAWDKSCFWHVSLSKAAKLWKCVHSAEASWWCGDGNNCEGGGDVFWTRRCKGDWWWWCRHHWHDVDMTDNYDGVMMMIFTVK